MKLNEAIVIALRITLKREMKRNPNLNETEFLERWGSLFAPKCTVSALRNAAHGSTWTGLSGAVPKRARGTHGPRRYGSRPDRRKLSSAKVRDIRARLKAGESLTSVARRTKMSRHSITMIRDHVTYRDVE